MLYRTDGTPEGTFGLFNGPVRDIVAMGSQVYFVSGTAVWKSDGTVAGTVLVAETHQGAVRLLASANGRVFMAVGLTPGSTPSGQPTYAGQRLLVRLVDPPLPIHRPLVAAVRGGRRRFLLHHRLRERTVRVGRADAVRRDAGWQLRGVAGIPAAAQSMAAVGSSVFVASLGGLYRVSNASASATLVKGNIAPVLGFGPPLITELAAVGNSSSSRRPRRRATDSSYGSATAPPRAPSPSPTRPPPRLGRPGVKPRRQMITAVGNTAYFLSADQYELGIGPDPTAALWKSDGTAAGTVKIRSFDLADPDSAGPRPLFMTAVAGQLVYSDADYLCALRRHVDRHGPH